MMRCEKNKINALFLILLGVIFGMPINIFAKEYSVGDIPLRNTENYLELITGDSLDISEGYNNGSLDISIEFINYKGNNYNIGIYGIEYQNKLEYSYELLLPVFEELKNNSSCLMKEIYDDGGNTQNVDVCPGTDEYRELIDYVFNKKNQPTARLFIEPYSIIGGQLCIELFYPERKEILLDIGYLNTLDASSDSIDANPVSYVKEDGTVVLKELKRDGYTFEGWYLDKDFTYKVTELNEQLAEDYFNEGGNFTDIEKEPVEEKDDKFVGKINLYAKWGEKSAITNPETISGIFIVLGISIFVILVGIYVMFKKYRKA